MGSPAGFPVGFPAGFATGFSALFAGERRIGAGRASPGRRNKIEVEYADYLAGSDAGAKKNALQLLDRASSSRVDQAVHPDSADVGTAGKVIQVLGT